jgi:hypothetical protein
MGEVSDLTQIKNTVSPQMNRIQADILILRGNIATPL